MQDTAEAAKVYRPEPAQGSIVDRISKYLQLCELGILLYIIHSVL